MIDEIKIILEKYFAEPNDPDTHLFINNDIKELLNNFEIRCYQHTDNHNALIVDISTPIKKYEFIFDNTGINHTEHLKEL